MPQTTQADDLIMKLVEQALARPRDERPAYLASACGGDSELRARVCKYVEWEERMGGFLLEPYLPPVADDRPFKPGQTLINRFRIVREVGEGGMSVVWEAWDERLERRVAIKCAKTGFGTQLPPEVRHARDVSHPNVCKIFDIHTASSPEGEIDFISMEFVEGETLSERLRHWPLSKEKFLSIARQLCEGLSEAHLSNVIHGDLKSNNVILAMGPDASVRPVIMDFGLARRRIASIASEATPSMDAVGGTPAYMAPELWKGVKPSVASDIYALGVVLWEMVSSRSPGDLGVSSPTLSWDERPQWKPPTTGYGRWDRILARCLDANPARRFRSVDEVARALGPWISRRLLVTIAAVAVVTILSVWVTYQRAIAPAETVRLALLSFASGSGNPGVSDRLTRDTADQLGRLKGSARMDFTFIPLDRSLRNNVGTPAKARSDLGATHVLSGELDERPAAIMVRAYLTDVRSGMNVREWDAEYKPEEMRYAPVALAGAVTGMLHLPPTEEVSVSAAARTDYQAGLSEVRHDSEVDAALGHFQRAVAADSDSPLTYAGLAEAQWFKYYASEDKAWLERATESVRQAENRNPDLAPVHLIAGLLKANNGWYEQAVAEYLRAIELEPGNGDAYRRLGMAYENNNQLEEALTTFRKAVQIDPQQYRNYQALGSFFQQRADYQEAARQFRKAVELAPKEPVPHFTLSAALEYSGQFIAAENELRTSIRLRETPIALHELGLVLMYLRREAEAIPMIVRALHLLPSQHLWWMNLGTAYRRVGSAADSKRAYRRGLDLAEAEMITNPRSGRVRAHLAYLCSQLGDSQRAESEIAQALQQSPNDSDTRFMAAITYEALGRRADTLAVLAAAPAGVVADLSRWPDVADLNKDSRFLKLLTSHSEK